MATKDVLKKAAELLKAQDALKVEVEACLDEVKSNQVKVDADIQRRNEAKNKADAEVQRCVTNLTVSGMSKKAFEELDEARESQDEVHAKCSTTALEKQSEALQYEVSDLEEVLKRVS